MVTARELTGSSAFKWVYKFIKIIIYQLVSIS